MNFVSSYIRYIYDESIYTGYISILYHRTVQLYYSLVKLVAN
jgi:hypothetical protein